MCEYKLPEWLLNEHIFPNEEFLITEWKNHPSQKIDLRACTDEVVRHICLLRIHAGTEWRKIKRELLAAIEENAQ